MENKDKIATKGQLKFLIASNIFNFLTIAVIVYEIYKKIPHFLSYIMIGMVFILMGVNQLIYYKNNNKAKKYMLMASLYGLIGLAVIIYRLFFFK